MGQLIDDLLAFAQIARMPLSRQTRRSHARWRGPPRMKRSPHRRRTPSSSSIEPLPPCTGEPVLLKQVFANLISNAIKFTAKTARARDRDRRDRPTARPVYYVRDNGVGFDERFAEKLFGVFQRLHRTVEFEGTGVGLAIVQRIINRHGGRVWAEGKVEPGRDVLFHAAAGHRLR